MELLAAVQAQVRVAGEQGLVGQVRGGVEGAGAGVAARGDDRVQVDPALQAAEPVGAAMDVQARVAQGPGDGAARVEAGGILPVDPVQYAPVGVQGQQSDAAWPMQHGDRRCFGDRGGRGSGIDQT